MLMIDNVRELRPKTPDTEKIHVQPQAMWTSVTSILMVQEGFLSNRTDFIRTAIGTKLERYADVVKQSTGRKKEAAPSEPRRDAAHPMFWASPRPRPQSSSLVRPAPPCLDSAGPACHFRGQGRSRRQNEVMRC